MNKSLLLLLLVVVGVVYSDDTDPVILQGILRDQCDHRMMECGYNGACCGTAGAANNSYGWVGTDFQLPLGYYQNNEKGLVGAECNSTINYQGCGKIGADRTPVYAYPGQSPFKNIQSPATFHNWFHNSFQTRNVPFNLSLPYAGNGLYSYTNFSFFPLDGRGWGDSCPSSVQSQWHNYGYCWESHFRFGYTGGEQFNFLGDDDVWAFINDFLVIDLGSLHQKLAKSVLLDTVGPYIGLQKASPTNPDASYIFDFFYCERHTTESNMQITTSLAGYCAYNDWCGVCEGNGLSCCTTDILNGPCNDNNACTADSCVPQYDPRVDPVRGCKHTLTVNCSSTDVCNPSQCNPSTGTCQTTPLNCNDMDPCTADSCISPSGCVHTRNSCDDKNVCTNDACDTNGNCVHTPKPPCNDNNMCTQDSCDPIVGCVYSPISCPVSTCFPYTCGASTGCVNSTLNCDDKTVCTVDSCVEGSGCAHRPISCDDKNSCTDDSCDPVLSCQHKDNSARCNDNNVCTNDGCDPTNGCFYKPVICPKKNCQIEQCVAPSTGCTYVNKSCDDSNACTQDSCDATSGQCVNVPIDCTLGSACRTNACDKVQGCLNTNISCDDSNVCTDDTCLAKGGCQHTDNSARCNDNNACTKDTCDPVNGCQHTDISGTCNDNNPCTNDVCIAASGCQNTAKDCNSNAPACQTGTCGSDGSCVYTNIPNCSKCQTPVVIDCKSNVTNKCLPWRCDPNTVQCVRDPDVVCNDNNNCTIDSCIPGTGLCNFTTKNCDDGNPCTIDSCDRVLGCINTQKPCDDHNVCTNDTCVNGNCVYSSPLTCNDGLACTDDSCNAQTGCVNTNKTCNDNNPCTTDSCSTVSGQCVFTAIPGQCLPCGATTCQWTDSCNPKVCDNTTNTCKTMPATCNDNSLCTNDVCIGTGPTYACNYTNIPCNPIDPCHTAVCDPINGCVQKIVPCDDKNPCTTDSCVIQGGQGVCQNIVMNCPFTDFCSPQQCNTTTGLCQVNPVSCTDGNLCTNDVCVNGTCTFPPVVCTKDVCQPAVCNSTTGLCDATVLDCDDGNQCTNDTVTCDESSNAGPQCVHTTNPMVCDDHKSCTNDYCNSSVPLGQNPCVFTPVVCPAPDACTDNITCVEGKGCVAQPKACALNDTANSTYCTFQKCDMHAGCIYQPRICPNEDVNCFTVACDEVQHCVTSRRPDFGTSKGKDGITLCALLYDEKARTAAITAGALAGIIIGSVAAAALIGAGGKAGYDFLMAKNNPMGPVATNPLYAQSASSGNNQLYNG